MRTREELLREIDAIGDKYGGWTYDIPLPHDVWTGGGKNLPHTTLKRILQIVHDLCRKPLSACRVLDLGCLEGMFSIEFAIHGAETVGVEIRDANIKKAVFCKDALDLANLTFIQDDVRNISLESHGAFDAIVCSGILYHLPASDAARLIESMFAMTNRLVVIDTHVAPRPETSFSHAGRDYWGRAYYEHDGDDSQETKAARTLASWDNSTSFWFTRPSLINLLTNAGFSSVYECFVPAHLTHVQPEVDRAGRCTIIAVKDEDQELATSPAANGLREAWPESGPPSGDEPAQRSSFWRLPGVSCLRAWFGRGGQ